jgi:hypothetical protein
MNGQGGFGGLGIGNPGSYGGQQSVGAPGFGGGYSPSLAFDAFGQNAWHKIKNSLPQIFGSIVGMGLTGNPMLGLGIGKLTSMGYNSDWARDMMSRVGSGEITPQAAEQMAAKEWMRTQLPFDAPPTDAQLTDYLTKRYYGDRGGPAGFDTRNTIADIVAGRRNTMSDDLTSQMASEIERLRDPELYQTAGDGMNTQNQGPYPGTFTMDDIIRDPRFAMLKNSVQQQFGRAEDNVMSQMPKGGTLLDQLTNLETDKARTMVSGIGGLTQDIADKDYGRELAQMGANVSLSGQSTAHQIASEQQMNNMMTMIGYGLASK